MNGILSHDAIPSVLQTADIRNGSASTPWVSMTDFESLYAHAVLGSTWNAADGLTTCKLQQATDNSGTGAKDLTTSGSGLQYDTANPVNAAGETVTLEARSTDLDQANGFKFVRLTMASTGNTGTDQITAVLLRYNARDKYAQRAGAAATGSRVYITA